MPRRLRRELTAHTVSTVPELGWSGKKNGELLQLMASQGFEALLTVDQNIRHQQNLQAATIAIIVLKAPSNRFADLKPLIPSTLNALSTIGPGQTIEIGA
ncbi:MAG TPA: hypothetical protein VFI31_13740 [Pirellulales bacterium]|nr:hypothetical protein [Pirellulales bacterium]